MNVVPRLPVIRAGDRSAGWSVFLVLLALFTLTFSGLPDNPDAEVEFQTTRSLARAGRLALGDTPEARRIVELEFDVAPGASEVPGREPRWYSWFGIGQALTGVPLYWAGEALARAWPALEERHAESRAFGAPRSEYFAHLLVGWRNPLLTAWTAVLLVSTALRLGSRRWHAWLVGMSYGLCTFAWPQARSTLSDVQATFFLFLAFHQLVCVRESLKRLGPSRGAHLALAGAALGAAVLTRVVALFPAAVLLLAACALLLHGRRRLPPSARTSAARPFVALFAPILVCAALFFFVNHARFGSALETGYGAGVGVGFFDYPVAYGLAGLLAAPGKGLLWLAPGLLLVPFGWYRAVAIGHRLWALTLVPLAAAVLVPPAMTATWHGAWTYGPRYALPLLPFLWLGVGYALGGRRSHAWTRRVAPPLFLLGFVVQVPAALVDTMTYHELATQAARERWPDETFAGVPGIASEDAELARFIALQWDWGFAAPWAHWRILRHRVAGQGERFSAREIFRFDSDSRFEPQEERQRGFRHLAWVDLTQRLGGTPLPAVAACCLLLAAGAVLAYRNVDPRAF